MAATTMESNNGNTNNDSANEHSTPPSPTLRGDNSLFPMGLFASPFERFVRDDASEWTSAFTLLDTLETFFDARMDLLERKFKKHSDRLKMRAEEAFKFKAPKGEIFAAKDIERELQKFKLKVSARMTKLSTAWQSAKVVRTREKISFFVSVMNVLATALIFGMAPQWLHIVYTVQGLYLLSMRVYIYKKRAWHYFLFDLCYYITILNFIFIWFAPSSATLWIACYCLSHGSLASAVITWRNSLVFHDSDKVTSLFIHIYAPLVFTVIRHYYPNVETRFPAVAKVPQLDALKAFALSAMIYLTWQILYWKFVMVDRRKKIESGERTTSFSWMLNRKQALIGRMLSHIAPEYRELSFVSGQLVYTILVELPVPVLYRSPFWSGVFLLFIFSVSVWNGGGFYIEVFGRKFERELEELRKELTESSSTTTTQSSASMPNEISKNNNSSSTNNHDRTTETDPMKISRDVTSSTIAAELLLSSRTPVRDRQTQSHKRTGSEETGNTSEATTESPVFVAQEISSEVTPLTALGLREEYPLGESSLSLSFSDTSSRLIEGNKHHS